LQSLALAKNQDMKTTIIEPLPLIYGDKHAIRRVLTNLVANAINYTPAEGNILVSATEAEKSIVISVQDNGRGIPADDLAKLFARFAQGTRKHRTTGTGLGLYLSRQIVEAHGGRIWAESEENNGSTFYFEMVKAEDPLASPQIEPDKVLHE
jgi:signal transduction histidine kinase